MPTYLPAFMSHAHTDNDLCDPYHRALTQRSVACYYDRANPQTGHSLSLALQSEIERAKVLIVMVSPAMLKSFWVEQEIDMFFALMAEDRQRMLIPIKVAPCEMPTRLRARWWLDATREPFDAIMDQLTRALTAPTSGAAGATSATAGPYSRIVDWRQGMGDYTTIVAALAAAQPGERILVRRGVYEGALTLDKPLELIGDGQPGDVEVRASGADVIMFTASQGRVANLTLRQTGGGKWYGVDIAAGRLELEDCDISSQSLTCVAIHDGANPILRHNRIHDGKQGGVYVHDQGQGLLEDNDIFANTLSGVAISKGGAPTLRHNRIHENQQAGVMIYEQGQGLLEDNDIFANTNAGVAISEGGAPTLRRNRIHDGKAGGVFIYEQGQGLLEDNDIFANTLSGVEIKTGGAPTLRHNRIHDGKQNGIMIWEQGQGTLEDNDIFANTFSGVEIKTGGAPTLHRNRIHDGKQSGVYVQDQGQGLLEDNDIFANAYAGVVIRTGGAPTMRRNRIHKNGYEAIWVYEQGGGVFEGNDLRDNTRGAWDIAEDSKAKVTRSGNVE